MTNPLSYRTVQKPTFGQPQPIRDLTPTARFVMNEVKQRLSEVGTPHNEALIDATIAQVETQHNEQLTPRERNATLAALAYSCENYDILTPLIENVEVNDIIVSAYNNISIQHSRKNIRTSLSFADADAYKAFVESLLKRVGRSCTLATPVVDTALTQHIRLCVTHESFSPTGSGPLLTLRLSRNSPTSVESLVAKEMASEKVMSYLSALISSGRHTLLIAGEVGTGKTTLVRALAYKIPDDQAILVIEDTHEIVLRRDFVRTLLTREANTEGIGRIPPAQAIRTGMRMAMNRIILGEIRDAEAADSFIDACASGHSGISTIHARSARDALNRLELFLARAQGGLGIGYIRRQIAQAISAVVYLGIDRQTDRRKVLEVVEIDSASDGAVQISPLFYYHEGEWHQGAGISRHLSSPLTCTDFRLGS